MLTKKVKVFLRRDILVHLSTFKCGVMQEAECLFVIRIRPNVTYNWQSQWCMSVWEEKAKSGLS